MHGHNVLTVATTGSDTGNCQSSPCKTLGFALTQASSNDTIVIRRGTYPESSNANVVTPGLTGLSIRSIGPGRTVIDATGNANGILIEASGVSDQPPARQRRLAAKKGQYGKVRLPRENLMYRKGTQTAAAKK